jgi:transcription elongation factor Elf1
MARPNHFDFDDDEKELARSGAKSLFKEFDCPSCNANNPTDPPFGNDDEVLCNYCGAEFRVKVTDEGKARFRET